MGGAVINCGAVKSPGLRATLFSKEGKGLKLYLPTIMTTHLHLSPLS